MAFGVHLHLAFRIGRSPLEVKPNVVVRSVWIGARLGVVVTPQLAFWPRAGTGLAYSSSADPPARQFTYTVCRTTANATASPIRNLFQERSFPCASSPFFRHVRTVYHISAVRTAMDSRLDLFTALAGWSLVASGVLLYFLQLCAVHQPRTVQLIGSVCRRLA